MFIKNKDDLDFKNEKYDTLIDLLKNSKYMNSDYSVGIRKIKPGDKTREHAHNDCDELYYIISGSGTLVTSEANSKIKQGDIVVIPKSTIHYVENGSKQDLEFLVIGFVGKLYDGWDIWV